MVEAVKFRTGGCFSFGQGFVGEGVPVHDIESKNKKETADDGEFAAIIVADNGDAPGILADGLRFDDGRSLLVDAACEVGVMLDLFVGK